MRGHRDLRLVVAVAVACAAVALLIPLEVVRVAAALPVCFLCPGYAIVAAAFASRQLDRGRLVVLTVGMSLATLVLCALVLNYVGGIRDFTWALILVAVVVAASRWAAIARAPDRPLALPGEALRVTRPDALMAAGGVVAVIVALVIAATVYPAPDAVGYARLWMLPTAGEKAVRVGVGSEEQSRRSYLLRVRLDGRELLRTGISLSPGEERELRVPIEASSAAGPRRITASLYRRGNPAELYRRVTSWLAPEAGR